MPLAVIGAQAPDIEIGATIAGPLDDVGIAGRNVVIEFWGTNCGPCAAAIPHFNKLVDKYASDTTVFISLSQDTADVVARYVQKRPIKGTVAVDRDGRTFAAYGIRSIPHTVLIDARGVLRWQGHPNLLSDAQLATFLGSGEVPAAPDPAVSADVAPITKPRPLFALSVNRNASGPGGYGYGEDGHGWGVEFIGCSVPEAIRYVLDDRSPLRMRVEGLPPSGLWDIEMRSTRPVDAEAAKRATLEALCALFGITLRRVAERRNVWRLTCPQPKLTDVSDLESGQSISRSKEELCAYNVSLSRLIAVLEPGLGVYLQDNTEQSGRYDFRIPLVSAEAARRSLEDEHGILCEPAVADIEIVVLEMPKDACGWYACGSEATSPCTDS